jgi:anti-sigma B factor antagonist
MDSTGLGLFVGTLKALNQNDKELYILGVSDRIGRLFEITGLKDLMMLFDLRSFINMH